MSVFHERYTKQFIWKQTENPVNLNESNANEEASSGAEATNEHKTYLERVNLAF